MTKAVICMRWGKLYPAIYVNILYGAVRDHLETPFRFICFTDDGEGLNPQIEVRPIPDLGLPEKAWKRGAWPKIGVFAEEAFDFSGRALFIDLDTMITGDLEKFFHGPGTFRAIGKSSWTKLAAPKPAIYRWGKPKIQYIERRLGLIAPKIPEKVGVERSIMGTGIFAFDIGAHTDLVDTLKNDIDGALSSYQNEQHFVQNHLESWDPWPDKTICSVKYHLFRPLMQSYFRHPIPPPAQISIVAFHGDPRPLDMATKLLSSKNEFPHVWIGKVKWLRDYWDKYSHL